MIQTAIKEKIKLQTKKTSNIAKKKKKIEQLLI